MTNYTWTFDEIKRFASEHKRPKGYIDELRAIAVAASETSLTFDIDSEKWFDLKARYSKSRGFGDTLAKLFRMLWIGPWYQRLILATTGRKCGCAKRQAWLNRLFPYKR